MKDIIGEMYGEHAFQAAAAIIACYRNTVDGVGRAQIGGVVLRDFCLQDKQWERWRGTMIFIPKIIECRPDSCERIDQMMVGPLSEDLEAYKEKRQSKNVRWKRLWVGND